jgi:hypothetical protein
VRTGFWRAALHLGGLWALAFAQPLLGLLGDDAEFFVARGSRPVDLVALALVYGLAPPLLAAGAVWAAGRVRPAFGRGLLVALVGVLVAALVLPPAGDLTGGSALAVPLAAAVGAAAAFAYVRAAPLRSVLTALSPAPVVVIVAFLLVSPVSELLTAGDASGSVAGPARSSTPIVQVILDELPVTTVMGADGRLDARRFPNLARLARGATWYRRATTVTDATLEAVPVQLTGELPHAGMLPTTRDHPRSLFTLFGRSHDLLVEEPITDVCPERLCSEAHGRLPQRLGALASDLRVVAEHLLLPDDLRAGLPPIDRTWSGFGDPDDAVPLTGLAAEEQRSSLGKAVGQALGHADSRTAFARLAAQLRRPRTRPPLVFMHSILPHAPWRFLPDGRRYPVPAGDPSGLVEKRWLGRQWAVDQAFRRHVLQAQYTDRLLGGLLDAVRAAGLYDRAVIVVAADHGASFTAGRPRRTVTPANVGEIAGVPLVVKLPHQRVGRIVDTPVRTVDVLPTIAAAAGVRMPWRADGRPADRVPAAGDATIEVRAAGGPGPSLPQSRLVALQRARNAREARVLTDAGPRPDLLGRRVATRVPRGGPVRARIAGARGYAHLVDTAATVPALVAGTVRGLGADRPLAVAVDGRVVATTRAYPDGDRVVFRALVPASALVAAGVTVTVLAVRGDELTPIGGT